MEDMVNHPPHYTQGKIEVLDFIEDQKLGMHEGNAVKYICRAKHKGDEFQDIEKAIVYLKRKLTTLNTTYLTPKSEVHEHPGKQGWCTNVGC